MNDDRSQRLQQFVDWAARNITGDEKGQAQIFLDRLFQGFGQAGLLDVGGTPEFRIKPGPEDTGGTSFADYVWKRPGAGVLIEMKKRGVRGADLARHRQQAFNYWIKLVPNRPQYTILCNFDEFWIYDFNIDLDEPLDRVSLAELPTRYDPLAFLFPTQERPIFQNNRVEVTRNAADRLASVFNHMTLRKVPRELAQRFILQLLVALFSEDIDLLPRNFLTNLLADVKSPEDSYDLLGGLFDAMNREAGTPAGRFKGIRYFNGGLFAEPAKLALDPDGIELAHLRNAAKENWSKVSPDIFGTLFQDSMDKEERHAFGGHYTAPIDIMKIVHPTLVEPWTRLIESATTAKKLLDLLRRISLLRVLDPACGSGNFLYLAYRELKRLEARIRERLRTEFPQAQAPFDHVNARQFFGLDISPFAIELAKVTMMLARKLAIDELHISDEPPLPLDNLDKNFLCTDALMSPLSPQSSSLSPTPWPAADVIIGNPPFLGAKRLKPERGPDYVNTLRDLYPEVPGMADYCVYWFRRAHDHLPVCTPDRPECGRAGLVGTQNIRNNQSRVGGLDYIVHNAGVIIEAVDNQPWSGEANVHVAIVNWVKTAASQTTHGTPSVSAGQSPSRKEGASPAEAAKIPSPTIDPAKLLIPAKKKLWFKIDPKLALFSQSRKSRTLTVTTTGKSGKTLAAKSYELDFREAPSISSALSDQTPVSDARPLACNQRPQRCFNGQMLGHRGFLLNREQRAAIVAKDHRSTKVIFPYLNGLEALTDGAPGRFVLDFDQLTQLEAAAYPGAFEWVKRHVLPARQKKAEAGKDKDGNLRPHHKAFLARWWQLSFGRPEMLSRILPLTRYLACAYVTKRPIMLFISAKIRPSNLIQVFAFDDDYSFGILQSHAHWLWFTTKCAKLTERYRYSAESVFDTFPWPQSPTKKQIDAVAAAGREIRRIRSQALAHISGGLRALYRTLELPGQNPLKQAHAALDAAVADAYGFPHPLSPQSSSLSPPPDLLAQLLALNLKVAADIEAGKPVTLPGVPAPYGSPNSLITTDCIEP